MKQEESQRVLTVMVCSNRKRIFFTLPDEALRVTRLPQWHEFYVKSHKLKKNSTKAKKIWMCCGVKTGRYRGGTATAQLLRSGKFSKRRPVAQLGGLATYRNIGFCCYLEPFISQRRAQGLLLCQPVWSSEPRTYEEWMCLLSAVCVLWPSVDCWLNGYCILIHECTEGTGKRRASGQCSL